MKYLLLVLVMIYAFVPVNAQDDTPENKLCDTLWWQQLDIEDPDLPRKIDIQVRNARPGQVCNDDGDTPGTIAYRAGASDEIVGRVLEFVAIHAAFRFLNTKNIHEQSFISMLKADYGPEVELFLNISTSLDIQRPSELADTKTPSSR